MGGSLCCGSFGTQLQFGILWGTAWQNVLQEGSSSGVTSLAAHWVPLYRVFPYICFLLLIITAIKQGYTVGGCMFIFLLHIRLQIGLFFWPSHRCLFVFSITTCNISLLMQIIMTNDLFPFNTDRVQCMPICQRAKLPLTAVGHLAIFVFVLKQITPKLPARHGS